ncbi:PP2C family protein-serine/threonine phosphatase [Actinomadura sp. WAC 06369]|uniref:PP2C family protein-serine/threonine phosphatase n=1 Tax=Actinomadura sp. WAC 06369 TaxID=2203193 RepID=UPI001F487917|nr:PP2C family protein-serine/threonine phosphatase [Actinomadura sp. WAC 06369]
MDGGERMLADLLAASHLTSLKQVPDVVAGHAAAVGLHDMRIYMVDLQQGVLRLLTGRETDREIAEGAAEGAVPDIRVDGTLAGRAFQSVVPVRGGDAADGLCHWWLPLLDGTERLGVVRLTMADDAAALRLAESLAALTALMIVSKGPSSDSLARLVRTRHMTVSAEMQWRLLPPMTFANNEMVIAAALEPAYKLGGDTFDYGLYGEIVHLGVFDAMGHDTAAGLTSNLAVAAYRNNRVEGGDLLENGRAIEEALVEQDSSGRFVTAVLASLHLSTGMLAWASYGHPPPIVIRGGRWVTTLECAPGVPLGTGLDLPPRVCEEQLQPGDRVILYTDGVVEARDPSKREFGIARFVDFIVRHDAAGLPVPETLRRLIRGILEHHAGRLDDDATVLLLEWYGPSGGERAAKRSTGL